MTLKTVEFVVCKQTKLSRAGTLRLSHANTSLATPACVLPTDRGLVPHLTGDLLSHFTGNENGFGGVDLRADELVHQMSIFKSLQASHGQRASAILAMPSMMSILRAKQPRSQDTSGQSAYQNTGDQFFTLHTLNGLKKMNMKEYHQLMDAVAPDLAVAPCDPWTLSLVNEETDNAEATTQLKRSKKAVDRTLSYLDQLSVNNATPLLANIFDVPVAEERTRLVDRLKSNERISGYHFHGFLTKQDTLNVSLLDQTLLPLDNRIRFMSGCWHLLDLVQLVSAGIDLIGGDYLMLLADRGSALVTPLPGDVLAPVEALFVDIRQVEYVESQEILAPGCQCQSCSVGYNRAYLHHLWHSHELLVGVLLMQHNMHVLGQFMARIRHLIDQGTWDEASALFLKCFENSSVIPPKGETVTKPSFSKKS